VTSVSNAEHAGVQAACARVRGDRVEMISSSPQDPPRLRCASVLKPLLFWAAAQCPPYSTDAAGWAVCAEAAVVLSDNDATVQAWTAVGAERLLDTLATLTGVRWPLEPGGARSFGRVLIRADELARGYAALGSQAHAEHGAARRLIGWMRGVPSANTFRVREAAASALGIAPAEVAVKCGWFSDSDESVLRTHAVTIATTLNTLHVAAVLTALPMSLEERAEYDLLYRAGHEMLDLHTRRAASVLLEATAQLLA
jgi:hypothetical protein